MSAARMNRLLTLEDPGRVDDGAGGYREVWTPLGQHWAEITPRTGKEAMDGSTIRYRIIVRDAAPGAPARPVPEQRFREGARLFHIEAVTEARGIPGYLVCDAYEETAA